MTATISVFQAFATELDASNDRRERLIKASRDITNLSKKVIFLLHRLVLDGADEHQAAQHAVKEGHKKLQDIQALYAKMKPELEGDNFWHYHRQVSPGLQEYIEALSFAHYLEYRTLISFQQVQDTISDSYGVPYFPLTTYDYLLGLSDLTGELMRFSISCLHRPGGRENALAICAFVRECKGAFEHFIPYTRELGKKQAVTAQSLQKIEDAAYTLVVRGSEYDLSPSMIADLVSHRVSRDTVMHDADRYTISENL